MNAFNLKFYEAENEIYKGDCVSLIVPTQDGMLGIMANHIPVVAAIIPGLLQFRCKNDEDFQEFVVTNGMIRVEGSSVLVLVDSAERPEEIDEIRAQKAAYEARELMQLASAKREYRGAQARLSRALNRLKKGKV